MESFWLLNTLVQVKVATAAGSDGVSVLEHRVPFGDSPPLHIHQTEDEVFHILEGEFRFQVAGEQQRWRAGTTLLVPKGTAHTYRVDSPAGGRFLTVTARGDFERFVRAIGRPAERIELPPPSGAPSPESIEALAAAAHQYGIELVGLPLE